MRLQALQSAGNPSAYALIEWLVELDRKYENPFDPAEVSVDAEFTGPEGKMLSLPAVWCQEFRREYHDNSERLVASGEPGWRVRFCAPRSGRWRMRVIAKDSRGQEESPEVEFTVAVSNDSGFVRRAPSNSRYLEFDDGRPYFVIGANVCWAGRQGLRDYEMYFSRLGEAGANYARVWMSAMPMETKATGLGRYDLANCFYYDQLLAIARKDNLRCMLALDTYGSLNTGGHWNEGRWPENPLNVANGGPLAKPTGFGTDPVAKRMYLRRLRYLIGRYAAYTSLGFWEFWNEQDLARGCVPAAWVAEMAAYLKAHDPYHHLVTTSFAAPGPADVWNISDIDLTQRHIYGGDQPLADMPGELAKDARAHDAFRKPHLIGEIGISWKGPDTKFDPDGLGTEFHNSLWAAALSGTAGGSVNWWWDSYLHPKNLYSHFMALSKFAARVDWPRRRFVPLELASPTLSETAARSTPGLKPLALAHGDDEFLVWLLDPSSNCINDLAKKPLRRFAGALLTLPISSDSSYHVEWWDTRKGEIIKSETASPRGGKLVLAIPAFERDIAARVTR